MILVPVFVILCVQGAPFLCCAAVVVTAFLEVAASGFFRYYPALRLTLCSHD